MTLLFEAPLADGARSPSVEVNGSVTWARHEGLSYQVGVHFDAAPNDVGDIVNAIFCRVLKNLLRYARPPG